MRRLSVSAFLCLLALLAVPGSPAQKPEMPATQLHQLDNKELLAQLRTAFNQAAGAFLGELRKLAGIELVLDQVRQQQKTIEIPVTASDEDSGQSNLDRAQQRVAGLKRRLALLQKENRWLEEHAQQLSTVNSSATAFLDRLVQLQLHFLEVKLRLEDGTLPADATLTTFSAAEIEKRKQGLLAQQGKLKQKESEARTEIPLLAKRIEADTRVLVEAEAQLARLRKQAARVQQEKKLEQDFSAQAPTALVQLWGQLMEERIGLKGTYSLSLSRFGRRIGRLQRSEKALQELTAPAVAPPMQGAEDLEKTAKAAEALGQFHTQRLQLLEKRRTTLKAVVEQAEVVAGDGTVLAEHLFKMQVLSTVLRQLVQNSKLPATDLPTSAHAETWTGESQQLGKELTETEAVARRAQEALKQTAEESKKSEAARGETERKLTQLQTLRAVALPGAQTEAPLSKLDGKALLQDFVTLEQALTQALVQQDKQQKLLSATWKGVVRVRTDLQALRDPLLRQAQREAGPEKERLRAELFKVARLELPASHSLAPTTATPVSEKRLTSKEGSSEKSTASAHPEPEYRTLLATRVRILQEQGKLRTALSKQLAALRQQQELYLATLAGSRKLALQRQARAVEIRTRLGVGKLDLSDVPDGINEALKRDLIVQIEALATESMQRQDRLTQELEALSRKLQQLQEMEPLLVQAETLVGKRQDLQQELKKLGEELERPLSALGETDRKALEQQALRRLEDEDTRLDLLLALAPSQRAEDLTGLLKTYYTELIDLENRKQNLGTQQEKVEALIKLAQEEKTAVSKVIPSLVKEAAAAEASREEETLRIRVALEPARAAELIQQFEQRTGQRFSAPLVVTGKLDARFLDTTVERIVEAHVLGQALLLWQRLFEQRLAESGLEREIGQYQDRLGDLQARKETLLRRIKHLAGTPAEGETAAVQGEIQQTRGERLDIRQEAGLRLGGLVLAIVIGAVLLNWVAGFVLNRYGRSQDPDSVQTAFVLSLCRALFRFAVWITALIIILSILGFNIVAILAGLGIGGLAIGLAAQETIADLLGGIMIFIERPFKIGDTIQIAEHQPAQVVGMTWRTTRLQDAFGQHTSVPNRQAASAVTHNFTREVPSKDSIAVYIPIQHDPARVLQLIEETLHECPSIVSARPRGVLLEKMMTEGEVVEALGSLVLKYVPWWYVQDYHRRFVTREEVWKRLWQHLRAAGIFTAETAETKTK